jgi:hypothetical protein
LYAFLISPMRTTYPGHPILLITFGEQYKLLGSSSRKFIQPPVSCYFLTLRSKYSPQHRVLKHCQYKYDCLLWCCCRVVWYKLTDVSEMIHHRPDHGSSMHLWNVGQFLPDDTAQHPRRQVIFIFVAVRFWNLILNTDSELGERRSFTLVQNSR